MEIVNIKEYEHHHVLREQEHVLREQEHVLQEQEHVLQEQEHVPREQEHVLREQEHVLREQEHVPREQEHVLREQEHVLREQDQDVRLFYLVVAFFRQYILLQCQEMLLPYLCVMPLFISVSEPSRGGRIPNIIKLFHNINVGGQYKRTEISYPHPTIEYNKINNKLMEEKKIWIFKTINVNDVTLVNIVEITKVAGDKKLQPIQRITQMIAILMSILALVRGYTVTILLV